PLGECLAADAKRPVDIDRIAQSGIVEDLEGTRHLLAWTEAAVPLAAEDADRLERLGVGRVDPIRVEPEVEAGDAVPAIALGQHPREQVDAALGLVASEERLLADQSRVGRRWGAVGEEALTQEERLVVAD